MLAWLQIVLKAMGGLVNGVWAKIPTGAWRKGLAISMILYGAGLWLIYDKVNCDMVSKDAYARSCAESEKKADQQMGMVVEAIKDLKDEIVGYRHDLQQSDRDRIKFLESELEKSRRRGAGTQ